MSDKVKKLVYLSGKVDKALWEIYKLKKDKGEKVTLSSIIEEAIIQLYKQDMA